MNAPRSRRGAGRHPGFTLIELLVVIAIIAVLDCPALARGPGRLSTSAEHLYNSPAERAHDDLLIVEVKSSPAKKGIL